jgi:hypothetical protein
MLFLKIRFKSSWTNSFLDEEGLPLFTSGSAFGDGQRNLVPAATTWDYPDNQGRVAQVRELNKLNPSMTYKVPANYDNTVRGILSRLMGEVCRLPMLEADHLAHEVFAHMQYQMDIESEHDEIVSLATPPNELQGSGAGLMPAGNPLYAEGPLAQKLFGHLAQPVTDILEGVVPLVRWAPRSPSELIGKLLEYKEAQGAYIASIKEQADQDGREYQSPASSFGKGIAAAIKEHRSGCELDADADSWLWAAAVIARNVLQLAEDEREALIAGGFLSDRGNFPGLAMSGKLGQVTIKDLFKGAGCKKAFSTRMPYQADLWFANKFKLTLGIIKKSGTVSVSIDLPEETAELVKQRIEDAAVGPFHFGKKGIAYLEQMYIQ